MMMKEKEFLGRDLFQRGKEIAATQEHLGQEYLCEDGKAQIDIFLSDKSELFNPLTVGQQRDLSPSVYQLIDEKMYTISLKDPVRLCFLGKNTGYTGTRSSERNASAALYVSCA